MRTTIPNALPDLTQCLATFGRDRCNWLAEDTWATEHRAPTKDDLCPNRQAWYVEVRLAQSTVLTSLCNAHTAHVEQHPAFVSARPKN